MTEVHIWPTLVGYVALTPDAFGFAFCANSGEVAKLRADLEAGVPMAQAVGFSGSSCGLANLVRVQSQRGSPTIIVVARDFLGKAKEDFTFKNQSSRDEFFDTLLRLLGPDWKCELAPASSCIALLLLIGGGVFGLLSMACGGLMLSAPPPEPKPGVTPMPVAAMFGFIVVGMAVVAGCALGFVKTLKSSKTAKTNWETISKR